MKNDLTSSDSDGGYYAIKGFIFQFDKSLAEVLAHPESQIEIEQTQDVSVDLYFTQVKYKETQTYAPSKIKKPVKQLLNELKDNPRGKYILYCYFKDKVAQSNKLTLAELNIILGKDSSKYAGSLKRSFIANFTLEFSENYDSQFIRLLSVIKDSFNLKTDDEALVYHAIFRTKLLEIATRPHRSSRTIQFSTLEALLKESQKTIFERAYSEYLSQKAYLSFLKKEYFTFKKIYVPREERLFVIEVDAQINDSDLIQIVNILQQRYYHKDRSPAPFICFIGLKSTRLKNLKRALWDRSLFFNDGTHFNGDKVRLDFLKESSHAHVNNKLTYKLISESQIPKLSFDKVYVFRARPGNQVSMLPSSFTEFYIEQSIDVLKVIS